MKVLLIHNQVTPYRIPIFNALAENVKLHVIFCYDRGADRFWKSRLDKCNFDFSLLGGLVIPISRRKFYLKPFSFFKIMSHRPDVIILTLSYETDFITYLAYLAARINKIPMVLWIADTDHRYFQAKRWQEIVADTLHAKLKGALVTKACAVVAYSKLTRQHVVETLGKNPEVVFIGSQVWPPQEAVPSRNFGDEALNFLYIGYLNERKRVDDAIRAFRKLPQQSLQFTIAGDGPQRQKLQDLCQNDARIKFVGYVEGEEKKKLLQESHFFIMPSGFDNMPNNILEAMTFGLPILATRECSCPEWLLDNALVFNAGDVEKLHQHMLTIISNPNKAEQMAKASLEISRKYGVPFAVNAFLKAIMSAINYGTT